MPVPDPALPPTRAERLKRATHETHERLDQRIMAQRIFESRERFAAFLRVQHRLHQHVDSLYAAPALQPLLPGLPARRRLEGISRDLSDLQSPLPAPVPVLPATLPLPAALGWLYVAEGSALGGAVIYKLAAPLGVDRAFGARHLAPPAGGVAAHWRHFTTALNAIALPAADERHVEDGARAAFAAVGRFVTEEFP
ncbi:biliverdin-producing heme oxygenase [Stenotrophomonas sp. Sa5BUN4]|uniref:Biliverdin-producing heme oxygenase n=1 Tax=Stenotrophomonas lacuserhaii TaxID=2760084 RepID=A0A8X8FQ93_9GAMM|nr:biliverdin-producing heme oxygenase [Stenotrophomonas pennii]MBD7952905.1 biliverdin-producing heme oxygenase [Stenotrophomonas pennii]